MSEEELEKLCDAWIEAEAAPDPEDDDIDAVAELKPVGFRLEHAGRYVLELRPKDFWPDSFGEYRYVDGKRYGELWLAFVSPDENYYFGDLKLLSRQAYDAALLGEALRDSEPFDGASDAFALVFAAIGKRDYRALDFALKAGRITLGGVPGEMVMDDIPDIVGSLTVFPL